MLVAIGFLLLLVGLAYVWQRQETMLATVPPVDAANFAGLDGQIHTLQTRLAQIEQRAPPPDVKPLDARITALETRPPPPAPPPAPAVDVSGPVAAATAPLAQRIDVLTQRLDALTAKTDAATAQVGTANAAVAASAAATQALTARVDALEKKLTDATTQLAAADKHATDQLTQNAQALRAQTAMAALEAGKPLGVIPDAPPTVAKFAAAKPPTEPELRLSFPAAASRAIDASRPEGRGLSLGARILAHAETLVTVRQGDKVLVGTTAAQTLGAAKDLLDAGNLAGAVAALQPLDPGAAAAMADWKAQAQSLLDARAALVSMTAPASH